VTRVIEESAEQKSRRERETDSVLSERNLDVKEIVMLFFDLSNLLMLTSLLSCYTASVTSLAISVC
jgi:hypothetical protein